MSDGPAPDSFLEAAVMLSNASGGQGELGRILLTLADASEDAAVRRSAAETLRRLKGELIEEKERGQLLAAARDIVAGEARRKSRGFAEPDPAPQRPTNRHERRRQAALARRAKP